MCQHCLCAVPLSDHRHGRLSTLSCCAQEAIAVADWAMATSAADELRETALMLRGDANTELRRWEVRAAAEKHPC